MHVLHSILLFHLLTCLGQNALGSEIIKGKNAPENLMLYMASLQNDTRQHVCGGFLISEDFVVTAAHCHREKPTSVVLGTHNLKKVNDERMRYSVTMACKKSFENEKKGNDIMLLKLSKKARTDKRVRPINLPKTAEKIRDNSKCRVAGWGKTSSRGEVVPVLQVADVPYVDLEACKRKWLGKGFTLPDTVICAGGSDKKGTGFCKGDSGGPLVCGGTAVGVVSFNWRDNCRYPNLPNVYTDVSKYLTWIEKIRKQKSC